MKNEINLVTKAALNEHFIGKSFFVLGLELSVFFKKYFSDTGSTNFVFSYLIAYKFKRDGVSLHKQKTAIIKLVKTKWNLQGGIFFRNQIAKHISDNYGQ